MDYAPFPLIDLSGNPRERGRQHGQAAPDRIKRGIAMYAESLLGSGVDWKELERRAEKMVPVVEKFDPTYVEEMRGIADGCADAPRDGPRPLFAQGHAVFVDFTAAWCVTCQINKQTTLSQADVLADFAAKQVRLMRADWTRRDPAISRALNALGRSGVPVYVLYTPNRPPEVLSELLSPEQVRQALAQVPSKPANN